MGNTHNAAAIQLDVINSDLTAPPQPRTSSTSLTFTAYYEGSNPAAQTFALQSIGSSGMGFSSAVAFGAGPTSWLSVGGPASGTLGFQGSQVYTASVSVAGLDLGTYVATNVFNVPGATNNPLRVSITLTIGKGAATVLLGGLSQNYDGTARIATATTVPEGLAVVLTYDGSSTAPTAVGSYVVTGVVDDATYQGSAVGTLVVGKGNQTILDFLPPDGMQFELGATTSLSAHASSGLAPITFSNLTPAVASLVGTEIAFTNRGRVRVQATQAGDASWNPVSVIHMWSVGGLITNVVPGAANVGGGIEIVVQGVNLGNGMNIATVTLAGVAATIVTQSVDEVRVIAAAAPAAATGDVAVTSVSGSSLVLANGFEYRWLDAPAMLPATDVTLYDLTAHWTGVADATAYFLEVGLDAGFAATLPGYGPWAAGADTNALVDGLLDETDYWLRAYSWNAAGRSLASPSLKVSTPAVAAFDFDADGSADLAAYQPATGEWTFRSMGTGVSSTERWGWAAALPVPADYDGDGVSDLAVYHPATGNWHIRYSTGLPQAIIQFGWSATVPVPADYDGDGTADLAVYHAAAGRWYFRCSTEGDYALSWGWSAAVPAPADYDGDGRTDVAVYHPASGNWYIQKSLSQTMMTLQWGWCNAVPVPGDYDGDGRADIAVYHRATGNWHIRYSSGIQWQVLNYGWAGTIPVQADYDGDGTTDRAIYHPATGNWSIRRSSEGADAEFQLGGPGQIPVLLCPLIHSWFGLP